MLTFDEEHFDCTSLDAGAFYSGRSDRAFPWAIQHWATRIGVKAPQVRFQMMSTQWGTITPSGWLTLDPMLLTMPKALGEFVIAHELVHLLVPKHGKLFKLFMHAYLPD